MLIRAKLTLTSDFMMTNRKLQEATHLWFGSPFQHHCRGITIPAHTLRGTCSDCSMSQETHKKRSYESLRPPDTPCNNFPFQGKQMELMTYFLLSNIFQTSKKKSTAYLPSWSLTNIRIFRSHFYLSTEEKDRKWKESILVLGILTQHKEILMSVT